MKKRSISDYLILFKPFGVLCQFTDPAGRSTLADFGPFPKDVYAAGRLDFDSEGLVLLTNDGFLKSRLLEPKFHHPRTYLVQVERVPTADVLRRLREGIILDGKKTSPAEVKLLDDAPQLPPRSVPIRFRKNVPTAWLEITLHEGRNRQVRRMTASVGFPTLRLIRTRIVNLTIDGLQPGEHRRLSGEEISTLRGILKG
jgi:23S rRNA pseudouridine2457 synthase